ncbi:hypothetical protein N482_14990 [Pseudoalteromonas luteoviolacea NCIMB 1942]|uniref:Uncharacterized protein n=1 Tax=Pseudoalteromonas luteoviolacea NCIMB 1942 TaxID=1365253 RepID=A0A167ALQ6_9GAMM|nr:hypothetical protein N482_14990 [Pseudoalteromonas luteoviolacea NCIMB 1942]
MSVSVRHKTQAIRNMLMTNRLSWPYYQAVVVARAQTWAVSFYIQLQFDGRCPVVK